MRFKTLQWNIGGGKILQPGLPPAMPTSYKIDGIPYITDFIKEHQPDIITLQGTLANQAIGYNQVQRIAEQVGYVHWFNDEFSQSRHEPDMREGQAVLTHFPITKRWVRTFTNPGLQTTMGDGSAAISHDKGCSQASLIFSTGQELMVQTLHCLPLQHFGVELASGQGLVILEDVSKNIQLTRPSLLQGDFNINTQRLRQYLPSIFAGGFDEIQQSIATNVYGTYMDHILYSGLQPVSSEVFYDVQTEHYPLVSEFKMYT